MSGIFGALNINDSDRVFLSTLGQSVVYDGVSMVLDQYALDLRKAISCFIDRKTSDHKIRYKLAGGGRLQRTRNVGRSAGVKAYGQWDVAFPLEDFGAQLASDRISMAYMTIQDLDRHLDTIMIQDTNTFRFELLYSLFHKTQRAFTDEMWGALTPECLANGDAVVYPPVLGSESEATEDHYLESGYAAASISDTNNPLLTLVNELEEHFGTPQGGSNIVTFINNAQTAKVTALANFEESPQRFVLPGDDQAVAINAPIDVPGRLLGYCDGTWVSEWRWVPANYLLSVHLDAPRPVMQRADPPEVGLGNGDLMLVARDKEHPIESAFYSHRFGLAVGNRLNGAVMELGTGGTYSIPSAYA